MSNKTHTDVPNDILESSTLSVSARLLYCILLKYCRHNRYCWPSQVTLANDLGRKERQVRNLLKELYEAGVLNVVVNGYKKVNFYYPAKKKLKYTRLSVDPSTHSISIHTSNTLPTKNSSAVSQRLSELLQAVGDLESKSKDTSSSKRKSSHISDWSKTKKVKILKHKVSSRGDLTTTITLTNSDDVDDSSNVDSQSKKGNK